MVVLTERRGHPLSVNLDLILPLLAKEIYGTPLAFLRENVQNAFDAVRLRRYRSSIAGSAPEDGLVQVTVHGLDVTVADSGIGMTAEDMQEYFWTIGRSGKATDEAHQAGVIGTFGIGGMANFGVASYVHVVSRVEDDSQGISSEAWKDKLSTERDCVFYSEVSQLGNHGTTITATLTEPLDVDQAKSYLRSFVHYTDIPITFDGEQLNGDIPPWSDPEYAHRNARVRQTHDVSAGAVTATVDVSADGNGRPAITWVQVTNHNRVVVCDGYLTSAESAVEVFRYGFKLGEVGTSASFDLGGVFNAEEVKPTAGRDSLDEESKSFIASLLSIADWAAATLLASSPELVDSNSALFSYIRKYNRYELMELATVRVHGHPERVPMAGIGELAGAAGVFVTRSGADPGMLEVLANQGNMVITLSGDATRRACEEKYAIKFLKAKQVDIQVTAVEVYPPEQLAADEMAFVAGLQTVLRERYFIDRAQVTPTRLTQQAVAWIPPAQPDEGLVVWLDVKHPQVAKIVQLRGGRYYGSLLDVFVRDYVFPLVKNSVPGLANEGFDQLLERLQSRRELLKIEIDDIVALSELEGQAESTSETRRSEGGGRVVSEVLFRLRDVVSINALVERATASGAPDDPDIQQPALDEHDAEIPSEVQRIRQLLAQLDVEERIIDMRATPQAAQPWLSGWYIGLSSDAHSLYRDILERRPATRFLWGGYRATYLFFERNESVLYYDLESQSMMVSDEGVESGSVTLEREAIFTLSNVFIPVPNGFEHYFVPDSSPLKFIVHHEILSIETQSMPI